MAKGQQGIVRHTKYKGSGKYIYRITLTDKEGTGYSLSHPTRFLSKRSVERRKRQGLPLDSTDLPVSQRYIKIIDREGVSIIGQSRWMNTLLVRMKDTTQVSALRSLPCVSSLRMVWIAPDSVTVERRSDYEERFSERDSVPHEQYGQANEQLFTLNGDRLHKIGLYGEGMMIGVLDGGFKNADRIPAIQHADICGWRDFVSPESPRLFSETDHGTKVLSTMAVCQPYYFVGTAPKASYWLLRSEDQQTEQEVEEDYWTMAAEFADSVGCDVINSSLGYNEYDHPWMTYQLWQLDGRTAFISRAASMLADKGIVLCNSAGNSGMGPWKKIGVPADADNIISVGAVNNLTPNRIAPFSSVGPSQDGRVKPDVVAIGAPSRVVSGRGTITSAMGTSFASPIVCGLVACLWQGMPDKTAREIIELVRQSGNNRQHPDNIYGYGMPNFWRAYMIGRMKNEE
jgi:subtilisin family serine protease